MNLQPLEDRIVVRTAEAEETTVSGLVIPDTAKEKPQQGEVLAVGPGRRSEDSGDLIPVDVAVGDTVVYSKYGGTEITVDGEDLLSSSRAGTSWPRSSRRARARARSSSAGPQGRKILPHPLLRSGVCYRRRFVASRKSLEAPTLGVRSPGVGREMGLEIERTS
jgi:chaperonin GroES